ncbi:amino acid permease [Petroclostridium sp. X23]|uniref:amino acid permease n=1 Tax=Petroclostridium sp. X23 TaxID=3045146 RepID=UPI0024AD72DA|nr:amino acid permease [Petroclostridium sp. X23]WHH57878.1 amino acid permease [Petroclostridium sp. X23]
MEQSKRLRTFDGVFTPTILTILGVIMYLRLGWITGNAGFLGTLVIILIAHIITICTTLSMSSMLTNIQIEAGGAYAIVARSLGLEMGGAIGIPLYLSQTISVAFYISGFTELWVSIFPEHPMWLIGVITWLVLAGISMVSATLAFRLQYIVLAAVGVSIFSFLLGPSINTEGITLIGKFEQAGFWETFAIFFPAVTGILAGASMSGELQNPKKSIIKGTLAAVFTGLGVYILLAFWFARQASQEMLLSNSSIIMELAFSKPLIIAGIMGAVLSSALSTLVGAPRTLAALADNRTIPFARELGAKAANGEPRNAVLVSSVISLAVILLGNLNSLAELLTLFFLTTYGMINLVVFLEQFIGVTSFRPRFLLSILVPIIGFLGCLFAMLLINQLFTLVTLFVVVFIYYILSKKNLVSPWGDVRGGVFTAVTEWAAQKAMSMPYHPRLWKPSIVIPVEKPEDFRRISRFVRSLIYPSGRVYYLTICGEGNCVQDTEHSVDELLVPLKSENLFAHKVIIRGGEFSRDFQIILQSMMSTFLPPNTAFFTISNQPEKQDKFNVLLNSLKSLKIGLMCMHLHPKYGLGQEKRVNLWLRDRSPNTNLAVLSALHLSRNWNASLYLIRVVKNSAGKKRAEEELIQFVEDARLPRSTEVKVIIGEFWSVVENEPADLNIFGMPNGYEQMMDVIRVCPNSILFVADSGLESALV